MPLSCTAELTSCPHRLRLTDLDAGVRSGTTKLQGVADQVLEKLPDLHGVAQYVRQWEQICAPPRSIWPRRSCTTWASTAWSTRTDVARAGRDPRIGEQVLQSWDMRSRASLIMRV